jgi:putative tricarboxylic transport membrane protein
MEKDRDPGDAVPRGISVRTAEIAVALILFTIGAIVIYDSLRLGMRWAEDGPQAGYFPFYIGLLVCTASLINFVHGILAARSGDRIFVEWQRLRPVMAVLIPALVYVFAIEMIGIYIASAIYIAVFMKWLGKYPWYKGAAVGLGVSVVFFLMFEVWFKVQLPKGMFNALGFTGY